MDAANRQAAGEYAAQRSLQCRPSRQWRELADTRAGAQFMFPKQRAPLRVEPLPLGRLIEFVSKFLLEGVMMNARGRKGSALKVSNESKKVRENLQPGRSRLLTPVCPMASSTRWARLYGKSARATRTRCGKTADNRPDPLRLLEKSNKGRIQELIQRWAFVEGEGW